MTDTTFIAGNAVPAVTGILAVVIFSIAFVLIATEKINKVKVVLIAAGAMAILGLIPGAEVFSSEHAGIDWNVIFLLFGMMVITVERCTAALLLEIDPISLVRSKRFGGSDSFSLGHYVNDHDYAGTPPLPGIVARSWIGQR